MHTDQDQDPGETRAELARLIVERAYKRNSHFRTPAGIVTAYFFDFLEISLKHRGVRLAGQLVYEELKDVEVQAVGGPGHGIASILCRAACLKGAGIFYIRDCMKKEGDLTAHKWIESRIKAGDRVAIVGDVLSTGSQIILRRAAAPAGGRGRQGSHRRCAA
jgi:orotate phosphoribosyltransferase